jgi:Zn-dependent protease with chaperone function
MQSDFFARQDTARRHTQWLRAAFACAVVGVALALACVLLLALGAHPLGLLRRQPGSVVALAVPVMLAIACVSWRRWRELREGGASVARALGGVRLATQESDPARRRLMNVVEEMALAARIPAPQVFVLPGERGINAFAAGHTPEDAAVGITAGALECLDRDELQAVVGHEFSHILNGDMALNTRLVAWLYGLMAVNGFARNLMQRGRKARSLRLIMFGAAMWLVGSTGLLAGRLLQAAVSRRREHLADASAVQFTRNPEALKSAFLAMAATASGSRIESSAAPELAHLFFASARATPRRGSTPSLFATHPPLAERVRLLDAQVTPPRFDLLVHEARRRLAARSAQSVSVAAAGTTSASEFAAPPTAAAATAGAAVAEVARAHGVTPAMSGGAATTPAPGIDIAPPVSGADPMRNRLSRDQQLQIAALSRQVVADPAALHALCIAAMLDAEAPRCRAQLARLAPVLGRERMQQLAAALPQLQAVPAIARLPLLTGLLGPLRTLPERERLLQLARAFARSVGASDTHRYCVTRIVVHALAPATAQPQSGPTVAVVERAGAIGVLLRSAAIWRAGAPRFMEQAYRSGLLGLLPPQRWPPFDPMPVDMAQLDTALQSLAELRPPGRRAVIDGVIRVIAAERRLNVAGVELLRTASLLLDCPIASLPLDAQFEDVRGVAVG